MKLFGHLPETLFQPLAGPRLSLHLYDKLLAARVLEARRARNF
jgi:hypothetical protein